MDAKKVTQIARNGLLIFVILTGMVWANTYYRGSSEYSSAEEAFETGNYKEAITNYGAAVRMYTPLAGYVPASLERLWEMGEGYQKAGQYDWSLIAYRELRSGIYAIRSFYTPYEDWIGRADERIEQVLTLQEQRGLAPAAAAAAPSGNE